MTQQHIRRVRVDFFFLKPNHNWNQSSIPFVEADIENILEGEN